MSEKLEKRGRGRCPCVLAHVPRSNTVLCRQETLAGIHTEEDGSEEADNGAQENPFKPIKVGRASARMDGLCDHTHSSKLSWRLRQGNKRPRPGTR